MLIKPLSALLISLSLLSIPTHAAFISTDWKSAGDKYATLDTETGLEWLDLTRTTGKSMNEVAASLSTTYKGWRFPTFTEIIELMTAMFPMHSAYAVTTPLTGSGTASKNAAWTFSNLFLTGVTETPRWAEGFFMRDNGVISMTGVYYGTNSQYWTPNNNYVYSANSKGPLLGVYLVSDGGTTLSSIQDPSLNASNPNAPINNIPPVGDGASDVSAPALGVFGLILMFLGWIRNRF